ncbi:twin-arginine translocation signal domain-containing protein [Kocuria sp. HSID16901]|nr:twin-arginine translocation signal domain-containing protein [Kocuria sp. HSID16901]
MLVHKVSRRGFLGRSGAAVLMLRRFLPRLG